MKNIRATFVWAILGGILAWTPAAYSQQRPKAELLIREPLTSMDGKQITLFRTEFPPGYNEVAEHRHQGETVVYVLSGKILNQIEDEEPRIYEAGDYFIERDGALHARFENADPDNPATYIVFGIRPAGEF